MTSDTDVRPLTLTCDLAPGPEAGRPGPPAGHRGDLDLRGGDRDMRGPPQDFDARSVAVVGSGSAWFGEVGAPGQIVECDCLDNVCSVGQGEIGRWGNSGIVYTK